MCDADEGGRADDPLLAPLGLSECAYGDPYMAKAPSTSRVREHRERRRQGTRCVQVRVEKDAIEALIRWGYLPEALQQDANAVREAVENYIADAPFMPSA